MIDYKLELYDGWFQIRKKAEADDDRVNVVAQDGFYIQGKQYKNVRSLWNYLKGCKKDLYVGEGVVEQLEQDSDTRSSEVVIMLGKYQAKTLNTA